VWLLSLGKNKLDFSLREEESLHSLYVREYDAFRGVVSNIAHAFAVVHMLWSAMQMFRVVFALTAEVETNC
jgi:thymidylate synthase